MRRMTEDEWRAFVMDGTRTAKDATMRDDGRPHVVPVWFVLDGTEVVFTTGTTSVKGKALRRDPRACVCVDDQAPPFAFVMIEGTVSVSDDLRTCASGRPASADATWALSGARSSGCATRSKASCWFACGPHMCSPRRTLPSDRGRGALTA